MDIHASLGGAGRLRAAARALRVSW